MSRGKSANNASKGVGGSREFSGADCRRVAAVIRAALVGVGGCCCCWGRWTCGNSESAATLKARRRSCRPARARPVAHGVWPDGAISQFLLFCSGFLAALLENVLPRCHYRTEQRGCLCQRRRRFVHSGRWVRPLYFLRNSDWEGLMCVGNVQFHNRDS